MTFAWIRDWSKFNRLISLIAILSTIFFTALCLVSFSIQIRGEFHTGAPLNSVKNTSKPMLLGSFSTQIQGGFHAIAPRIVWILRGVLLFCAQNSGHFREKCVETHEVDEHSDPNPRGISWSCPKTGLDFARHFVILYSKFRTLQSKMRRNSCGWWAFPSKFKGGFMQLPLNLVRFCAAFCYFVLRVQDILIQNASKLMMLMSFSIQIQRGFRTIALHPA